MRGCREDIRAAARMYANAKPAAIAWGLAFDQNPNGVQAGHTAMSLMAITGNCDVPGGQLFADMPVMEGHQFEETDTSTYGWDRLGDDLRDKCIGIKEYPYYVTTSLNAHARPHVGNAGDGQALPDPLRHDPFVQSARPLELRPAAALACGAQQAGVGLGHGLLRHADDTGVLRPSCCRFPPWRNTTRSPSPTIRRRPS